VYTRGRASNLTPGIPRDHSIPVPNLGHIQPVLITLLHAYPVCTSLAPSLQARGVPTNITCFPDGMVVTRINMVASTHLVVDERVATHHADSPTVELCREESRATEFSLLSQVEPDGSRLEGSRHGLHTVSRSLVLSPNPKSASSLPTPCKTAHSSGS
jgi:hypothetical protein